MDILEMVAFLKTLDDRVDEIRRLEKHEGMNAYNGYSQRQILFDVLDEKISSYRVDEKR